MLQLLIGDNNMIKELTNDPFYIVYKKYNRCVLDYL